VIGYYPPILTARAKKVLLSGLLSMPVAASALVLANIIPWLRFVISPGSIIGQLFSGSQSCGGLVDCLAQSMAAFGTELSITLLVNAVFYGLVIFRVTTMLSFPSKGAR
jgi:hypothetical protein